MTAVMVACTIVLFLLVDSLRGRSRRAVEPRHVRVPVSALANGFSIPEGLFVGAGHTWARLEADGSVCIGVDDFASKLLGRVDRLELAGAGAPLGHGDAAFVLHQGDKSAAFASPVEGTVTAVNAALLENPEHLRAAPYDAGWLLRLRPHRLGAELRRLRLGAEARSWLQEETARFADFLSRSLPAEPAGVTLQDGGLPVTGVLEQLDTSAWERFESEFLARH